MSSIAARSTSPSRWSAGGPSFEYVATADTARVIAWAYGADAAVRCCAFIMRDGGDQLDRLGDLLRRL